MQAYDVFDCIRLDTMIAWWIWVLFENRNAHLSCRCDYVAYLIILILPQFCTILSSSWLEHCQEEIFTSLMTPLPSSSNPFDSAPELLSQKASHASKSLFSPTRLDVRVIDLSFDADSRK